MADKVSLFSQRKPPSTIVILFNQPLGPLRSRAHSAEYCAALSMILSINCRAVVRPCDVFDDLLAWAHGCLSHHPLLGGDDEPQTLSFQVALFGPIGADVRQ